MAGRKAVVTQDIDAPIERPILAKAIVDISVAVKKLVSSGLNRKAILVLLHHDTNIPQRDIKTLLDSMADLQKTYLS